jgi:penicillin-binding protein 1A
MFKYKKLIIGIVSAVSIFIIAASLSVFIVFSVVSQKYAYDDQLFNFAKENVATVYYAKDEFGVSRQIWSDRTFGGEEWVSLTEIPEVLKMGFIAAEDRKFYKHSGVDVKRTAYALLNQALHLKSSFGASTITQQVVKNISGDNQFKLKRKLEEIIRAIHIERNYSKDEILEVYLNVIPMSDNIYGVGAAAKAYFGCEPGDLTAEQAATLIGITNAPTAYSPYIHPETCRKKRDIVLSVMHSDGIISGEEYSSAKDCALTVIPREKRTDLFDSWFVERVIDDVCADISTKYEISPSAARLMLLSGGYKVYTTMNIRVQKILEDYFYNKGNFPSEVADGLNYAMTVTDAKSGSLVGLIGRVGKKTGNRLLNHATVPHIPGSTLKPIALYAPLLDDGKINWATVFDDVPVSFSEESGEYREYPRNSPAVYNGLTTVKDGLCYSKNTLAVRLCNIIGARRVFDLLRDDFGFDTLIEREGAITDIATAPMALGQLGRGVSLLKLTESYSVFTGEGVLREANSYSSVVDHKGAVVLKKTPYEKAIFKPTTIGIMNQILMSVTSEGTANKISLKNKVDTAGKTGTSAGSKDKIFVGYTPYFTAGIWCGYDKGENAVVGLSKSHLEIWDEIMLYLHDDELLKEKRKFTKDGLLYLPYCKDSGREYSENCIYDPRGDRMEYGYFTEDNLPFGKCDRHILCYYDTETKGVATSGCPSENLALVSLISVKDRAFPKEITVSDAEFVYRDVDGYTRRPVDYSLPYFYYTIPDGVFVGRSKGKKQFNSSCYLHDD